MHWVHINCSLTSKVQLTLVLPIETLHKKAVIIVVFRPYYMTQHAVSTCLIGACPAV